MQSEQMEKAKLMVCTTMHSLTHERSTNQGMMLRLTQQVQLVSKIGEHYVGWE